MKIFMYTLLIMMFVTSLQAQDRKTSPATVEKVSNVPVFIFSVPVADYEIVGKAVTAGHIIKISIDETSTVRSKTEKLVNKAVERSENGKVPAFDAIIIDLDKEKTLAIKFKDGVSQKAKVLTYETVPVFLFSLPDNDYDVIDTLPADYSLRAQRGLLLDKIESMINRTLKKEENGEVDNFDAVIINPEDLSETLIRFK